MKRQGKRIFRWMIFCAAIFTIGSLSSQTAAFDIAFHGYVESNIILRDTNGFQYGLMDQAEGIQQKTTLKIDLDAYPRYPFGPFSLDKIHLTYRGAYDSIFQWRDKEYGGITDERSGEFNYGKDDIEWENDLREAFLDLAYQGSAGSFFFRPGRQLVSWGEVSGATILDRINPSDISFMISAFPDELKTPLWMLRFNYSIPPLPSFNLNFDGLVIPDVRPLQLGPLDESMQAPYIRNTAFSSLQQLWLNPIFAGIYEDVPTHRTEYGIRLTADVGANLSVSGVFFSGASDNPGILLSHMIDLSPSLGLPPMTLPPAPSAAQLKHPWTKTYGLSFNYYVNPPVDIVLKGEFGYTQDTPVAIPAPDLAPGSTGQDPFGNPWLPFNLRQYRLKDTFSWMIGFDRNWWWRWLSPSKMVTTGFQWIHQHIDDLDSDMTTVKEDTDWFSAQFILYYWHGKINPVVFVIYDTEGTWMTSASVSWTISKHWKAVADQLSFWGNNDGLGRFASSMGNGYDATDQMTLKIVYQW